MKFLLIPLIIFNASLFQAQSVILLENDFVSDIQVDIDISEEYTSFDLSLYFENNTDEKIAVNWRREFSDNCPEEWEVITADPNITYIFEVNESYIPITMLPNESSYFIQEEFYPRTVPGCCDIKMIFSLEGDPENPIDTGYYHMEINAVDCQSTYISANELNSLNIYPNPANDFLYFENTSLINSLEIFDASGRSYLKKKYPNSGNLDISSLKAGWYFCKIESATGLIRIQKFIKE